MGFDSSFKALSFYHHMLRNSHWVTETGVSLFDSSENMTKIHSQKVLIMTNLIFFDDGKDTESQFFGDLI